MLDSFKRLIQQSEAGLQQKVEQVHQALSQAKMSYDNAQKTYSPIVENLFNLDRIKQGASNAVKEVPSMFQSMLHEYKANLGIPDHLNSPIDPNSALGKFGQGVINFDNYISTQMPGHQLVYDIPKQYGTDAGQMIAGGVKQIQSGQPSNVFGVKVPSLIAGPAKIGLGTLGVATPAMIVGDYAMEGAKALATPVFGKDSLATSGIGLVAGILAPGGEASDAKNAVSFAEKLSAMGQKGLSELPKEERLSFLVNYGKDLLAKGYKMEDIKNISAPKAFAILQNDITPATFANRLANEASAVATKTSPLLDGAKEAFQKWVNYRKAGDFEALAQKKAFQELDSKGLQGIFDFQAGNKTGIMGDVQKFFDNKYQELKTNGIKFGYKENYLPQLWANTQDEINQVFGKTLNQHPGFSLKAVIKDYEEGISKGLTPRFNTISELVASYEKTANKAMADHEFFNFLAGKKFIMPETKAPSGWKALDSDLFPRITAKIDGHTYSGVYKAEPELADLVNNYLRNPEGPVASFAQLATRVKNIGLAGGIPGTAFNFHGVVNILRRDLLVSDNPVTAIGTFIRDMKWMAKPDTALEYVNKNLADASYFTKNGLTISAEDWGAFTKDKPTSLLGKAENKWNEIMGDPLFKKTLPAIKLDFAKRTFEDLKKSMPDEVAVKKASEIANNVFGGINLDEIGRSKQMQNILRSLFIAPDWSETQFKIGSGILKGVTHWGDAETKTYRTIAKNMAFYYVLENVANKVMSGHYMFQNDGNHQTEIDTGSFDSSGAKRYITTWGTAQDYARIPYQIVQGIAQGNPGVIFSTIQNRFSLPISAGTHLLSNQDYLHRPIYGNDKYGNPIPAKQQIVGVGNELLNGLGIPVQIRSGLDYLSGKSSGEQAIVNSVEAPIRYSGGPVSQKQIDQVQNLKSVGLSGQEINNVMHNNSTAPTSGGFLSNLFGAKKPSTPSDPLMVALQKEQDLSDRQKKVRDIFAMNLPVDKTSALLAKENLGTYQDNALYMIKTLSVENGSRPDYLKQMLSGLSSEDYAKTIDYLAGAKVLTTSVTSYWNDNGMITDGQKKAMDSMIKTATGKRSAPKLKKPSALPSHTLRRSPLKLKLTLPKFRPLTPIKAPKLSKVTLRGGVLNG